MRKVIRCFCSNKKLQRSVQGRLIFALFIFLSLSVNLYGQNPPFTPIAEPSPLTEVRMSAGAWGDYDNDGDLDILLTGSPDSTTGLSTLYRNDGDDIFVSVPAGLSDVFRGAVAWGDYDNDNDLDILLTGTPDGVSGLSRVYRNDGGVFTDIGAALTGVFQSSVAWGDYDNDGDQDILLTGTSDGATGLSRIYRNDNGSFVEVPAGLTGVFRSAVAWGDYDNDGDLDILLSGTQDGTDFVSRIYRNDGGNFVDIGAALTGVSRSAVAWGDYDSDGDLDIALSGMNTLLTRVSEIYRNDNGNFVNIGAPLIGVSRSSIAWGDYDNDGDLDLLLTGRQALFTVVSQIYRNDAGSFVDSGISLPGVFESSAAWGDFDNDDDLDILLTGTALETLPVPPPNLIPFSNIYRNNGVTANTVPGSPPGLQVQVSSNNDVTFSWGSAIDNETPQNGLNYNLRVGTAPGGNDVFSSMAETAAGNRKVAQLGNTNQNTSWGLNTLPDGTYYWSVQSIDNAFAGSPFAQEKSFTLPNQPPVVINPIADTTLNTNNPPLVRDLEAAPIVFNDPDGDPLSYSTQSLNPAVATAVLNGSVLTVTPLITGTSQIIVTANDNVSGAVSDTFVVTVTDVPINQPPVVVNPIPDTTLNVNNPPFIRDLEAAPIVFNDPDGDPLSYSAQSLNPAVAIAVLNGSVLTVTPLVVGTSQVIVTADDNISGAVSDTFVVTVTDVPINQPPVVVNPIADTTLNVNNPPLVRDLEAAPIVFNDPDGDPLSYSTQSLNPAVATAVLNGSVLTVTPLTAGTSQVIVTADDNISGAVSDTFVVTVTDVPINQPPVVVNPIPDTTLNVNNPPLVRDLEAAPIVFSDPDGDPLSYSTQSLNPTVATAVLNGSVLTVTPLITGTSQIIVTANDNISGAVSDTFVVTVTDVPINQPPVVVNPIPDTTLNVNNPPFIRDLEAAPIVFSDPDGDPLSYSTQSLNPTVATAGLNGSVLTVTPLITGTSQIIVTANDNISGAVSDTFVVTVTDVPINQPPVVVNPIPDTTLNVNNPPLVRDLEAAPIVFSDPDGDPLSYSTQSLNPAVATAVLNGSVLTVTPLTVGTSQVIVTADDNISGAVSDTFMVTVIDIPVNQPPVVVNPIPDTTLNVNNPPFVRDLETAPIVFSDPDGDPLSYSTQSLNPAVATAILNGSVLTVTPLAVGTSQVIVTANDNISGAVSDTFVVTVTDVPINQPPVVVNPIPDTTLNVNNPPFIRDLETAPIVFSDPDGDPLSYTTQSLNPTVATAVLNGSVLTVTPLTVGTSQVIVTADDNISGAVSDTFVVTVTDVPINQPPVVVNSISDTTLRIGDPPFQRDLNTPPVVFSDPDGDPLTYSAASSNPSVASVSINESLLRVNPLGAGNALVFVTANDGNGGTVADTFTVTVMTPGNEPPVVINPIPDTTLRVGGPSFQRDLNAPPVVFSDPNGDVLSFTAKTSDSVVATASIAGSVLTVMPVTIGNVFVYVVARDGNGGSVTDTFEVVVFSANLPPVVANPIPDTTLVAGGTPFVLYLDNPPQVFVDPDGDPLSYTAVSLNPLVATATIAENILHVIPLLEGSAQITVTANDDNGGTVTDIFMVFVTASVNQPPVVITTISDTTLVANGLTFQVELDTIFSDPDNDRLSFGANSSNPTVAAAFLQGSLLNVTPLSLGSAEITAEANDGRGGITPTTFTVMIDSVNRPPVIDHVAVTLQETKTQIEINAEVTDDIGVERALLSYRKGGDGAFSELEMIEMEGMYRATIPSTNVLSQGVEYFISAEDIAGLSAKEPASGVFSVRVSIPDPGIVKSTVQPGGSNQASYRLVSLPIDADRKNPLDALGDDLGDYSATRWRFFELRADQRYYEYPNTSDMEPGKAFWLIVRPSDINLDTGSGVTNSTAGPYAITLHPGWNFIGNPYNFSIPVNNLEMQSSGTTPVFRYYNGAWNNPADQPITSIQPFEGYAVLNNGASEDVLLINPSLTPVSNPLAKGGSPNRLNNLSWGIRILARCQEAQDVDNIAAVSIDAASDWDALDYAEPPVIGEFVSVYFPHPEWEKITSGYCTDVRPAPYDGDVWEFEVRSNIHDRIELTFDGIENVPAEFEVWLVDKNLKISQNLRENPLFSVAGNGENSPRRLSLVVGKQGFIDNTMDDIQVVPPGFELSQNFPNPFNPATTIRYGLPREEIVTLKVYDMLGQEVALLVNREKKASGYHIAIWDGKDRNGAVAASGVYVYQLQAGKISIFKKMILLK